MSTASMSSVVFLPHTQIVDAANELLAYIRIHGIMDEEEGRQIMSRLEDAIRNVQSSRGTVSVTMAPGTGHFTGRPVFLQSAFILPSGQRILVYTSEFAGITSYHCDQNFKTKGEPFATAARQHSPLDLAKYHRDIRAQHEELGSTLVLEHSSVLP